MFIHPDYHRTSRDEMSVAAFNSVLDYKAECVKICEMTTRGLLIADVFFHATPLEAIARPFTLVVLQLLVDH